LGKAAADPSTTSIGFNTTSTVAAGGFIIVQVGGFTGSATVLSVANSGTDLGWTINKQGRPASPSADLVAIASAQAPSGLASGTTITATYSAGVAARQIGGSSFTGVATSSPVDGTPTGPTGSVDVQPWSTASYTILAGSLIYATCYTESGNYTNTAVNGSQAILMPNAASPTAQVGMYRVESSAGSYTVSGSWSSIARAANIAVAYKAVADVPPNIEDGFAAPAGMFSPGLIEKGWWH
jgi:hypothetical protein